MASARDVPIVLVEEIFVHLDDAADLVRASAACASFRRVVSDGRFLRRWRSLRRRPVLGLLSRSGADGGLRFHPAVPPRRSAQAARAVVRAGLSSSSLPVPDQTTKKNRWHVHDARDGRVLLSPGAGDATTRRLPSFPYLVVYDTLHRKHVEIPPIPADMVACCTCSLQEVECYCVFDPFLVPAAADDDDDLSFRVICTVLSCTGMELEYDFVMESFVYSSVTGKWRGGAASLTDTDYDPLRRLSSMDRHYAHGCFYWVWDTEKMLVLDTNEMKFSFARLPPGTAHLDKAVVQAAADEEDRNRIGLLVLWCNTLTLYTKAFGSANDCWHWRRDGRVTLLNSYRWFLGGAVDHGGYALLRGIPQDDEYLAWMSGNRQEMRPKTNAHYFTVEIQTLLVEQLCVAELDPAAFLYAGFPPPFAPPSL